MATVEARSTTGQPRNRAGLRVGVAFAPFEVSEDQLAALRADKCIDLRGDPAAAAAQGDMLEAALTAALARIAELEVQLAAALAPPSAASPEAPAASPGAEPASPSPAPHKGKGRG